MTGNEILLKSARQLRWLVESYFKILEKLD